MYLFTSSSSSCQTIVNYGVKFYGDELYFDSAGHCEIVNYNMTSDCYCSNVLSQCSEYSTSYVGSCSLLVSGSYLKTIEACFIVAMISVVLVGIFVVFSIWYYQVPEFNYHAPTFVQASEGVPTTAVIIKPITVLNDAERLPNDFVVENGNHLNSYFGVISRQSSRMNIAEPEAIPI